jgi:hypothetical protein
MGCPSMRCIGRAMSVLDVNLALAPFFPTSMKGKGVGGGRMARKRNAASTGAI